jgi:DNA mismatch endonuclease (patch repair protein)
MRRTTKQLTAPGSDPAGIRQRDTRNSRHWRNVDRRTTSRMRLVRQTRTRPERLVEHTLRSIGAPFLRNGRKLPGSPDFYSLAQGWALFVHGCFWHGHENCRLFRLPSNNRRAWAIKVAANRKRDAKKARQLRLASWSVYTVWQCDIRHAVRLEQKLRRMTTKRRTSLARR